MDSKALVAVALIAGFSVSLAKAATHDEMAACADERIKTSMLSVQELAGAEASCTKVLDASPDLPDLQKAAFFRGLVRFLKIVQTGATVVPNADGSLPAYKPPTKEDVASALLDVENAIGIDGPMKGDATVLRITINQTIGEPTDVAGEIDKAVGALPGSATPLVQRALEAERRGELRTALKDLDQAIELDPKAGTALMSRALLLRRVGRLAEARKDLIAVIALGAPFRRLALIEKSEVEARTGDLRASFDDLIAATREAEDMSMDDVRDMNADLLVRAGDVALNFLKDPDTAEAVFNQAAELRPKAWDWVVGVGRVAEARGEKTIAIDAYKRVLAGTFDQPYLLERNDAAWRLKRLTQSTNERRTGAFIPGFEFGIVTERPAGDGLKRLALVIGSGNYAELPNLPNALRDAAVVANRFADLGFDDVEIAEDLETENLLTLPDYVAKRARDVDIIVVFYAGHGVEVAGNNYLVPIDATLESERQLSKKALALRNLTNAASRARRGALLIIDACRDDPFIEAKAVAASRGGGATQTVPEKMRTGLGASPTPPANNVVLHSTQAGKTAADGEGLDSPFVVALLQTLSTPGLSMDQVVRQTTSRVADITKGEQIPAAYGKASTARILPTEMK